MKINFRILVIFALLSSNIGCDQFSKRMVRESVEYHEQIPLFKDYLTLTKVENTGAFLSVGHTLPPLVKIFLLTVLPIVVLTLAVLYLLTKKGLSNLMILGICFIVGGGIGNIYDRVMHGSVTDFLHIDLVIFQTGIFNMADVSIMTGIFIVLLDSWLKMQESAIAPVEKS
jgi:signal peptidase II